MGKEWDQRTSKEDTRMVDINQEQRTDRQKARILARRRHGESKIIRSQISDGKWTHKRNFEEYGAVISEVLLMLSHKRLPLLGTQPLQLDPTWQTLPKIARQRVQGQLALTEDKVVGLEEWPVGGVPDGVHGARLQVHQHRPGHVASSCRHKRMLVPTSAVARQDPLN